MRRLRLGFVGLAVIIIAVGMLYKVWGYSSAAVNNDAVVTFTESENALVAVKVDSNAWSPVSIIQGQTGYVGSITNNTSEVTELTVIELTGSGGFIYDTVLLPGQSTSLLKYIFSNEPIGQHTYPGLVMARWGGGSAEIEFEVCVYVVAPPEESVILESNLSPKGSGTAGGSIVDVIRAINETETDTTVNKNAGQSTPITETGNGETAGAANGEAPGNSNAVDNDSGACEVNSSAGATNQQGGSDSNDE